MKHFNPRARLIESSEAADVTSAFQDAKEQHIYNRKMGTLAIMTLGIIAIVTENSSTATLVKVRETKAEKLEVIPA